MLFLLHWRNQNFFVIRRAVNRCTWELKLQFWFINVTKEFFLLTRSKASITPNFTLQSPPIMTWEIKWSIFQNWGRNTLATCWFTFKITKCWTFLNYRYLIRESALFDYLAKIMSLKWLLVYSFENNLRIFDHTSNIL